jgi:hypothetical protein
MYTTALRYSLALAVGELHATRALKPMQGHAIPHPRGAVSSHNPQILLEHAATNVATPPHLENASWRVESLEDGSRVMTVSFEKPSQTQQLLNFSHKQQAAAVTKRAGWQVGATLSK